MRVRRRPAGTAKVMFFSFSRSDKISGRGRTDKGLGRVLRRNASRDGGSRAVAAGYRCLCQDQGHDAAGRGTARRPEIVRHSAVQFHVTSGGDAFALMAESRVVVGFNTHRPARSAGARKARHCPALRGSDRSRVASIRHRSRRCRRVCRLPRPASGTRPHPRVQPFDTPMELSDKVEKILQHWLGNDDGLAGRRAYAAICREVKRA